MIVGSYLDLISLVVGCMVFRKSWPFAYRCLFFLNTFRVLVEFSASLWSYFTRTSNHWLYNLFLPLQCVGFLLVFYKCSFHPAIARINRWLLAAFPVVTAVCWLTGAPLNSLNLWAIVGFDFLVLVSACLAFVDQLLRMDNSHFIRQPIFWLASGLFFYSVQSIIGYATWEYFKKMIYFRLYTFIFFSGEYLLDVGIIGCWVCIYLERVSKKPETDLRQQA